MKILITGVTGQDGSHMADYLLRNTEHTVICGVRRLSVKNHKNISHLLCNPRFFLIDLDVTDAQNIDRVIQEEKPDYFINFHKTIITMKVFFIQAFTLPTALASVESREVKSFFHKLPDGVSLARRKHVVLRCVLIEHFPYAIHEILCIAPVPLGVQVA